MSTRAILRGRQGRVVTDPKYYQYTSALGRKANRLIRKCGATHRDGIVVRVLDSIPGGAPARFVDGIREIDFDAKLLDRVDPLIVGTPEGACKHPKLEGAGLHEIAHAIFSTMNLERMVKKYGDYHTMWFLVLEEGRCESCLWPNLESYDKLALRSMILDLVLEDLSEEDKEGKAMEGKMLAIRLHGLTAGRIANGVLDITHPKIERIVSSLKKELGEEAYEKFRVVAVTFSNLTLSYWESEDRLHEVVEEWLDLLKEEMKDEDPGTEEGPEGGCVLPGTPPTEGKDGKEGDGEGKGEKTGKKKKGESKGGSKKGEDKEGEGKNGGKEEGKNDGSKDGAGEPKDYTVGDDDEGRVGDGSQKSDPDKEGGAALGGYASSHIADNALGDLLGDLKKLVEEARNEESHIAGSRLKEELVAVHRADAGQHRSRRQRKEAARRVWKNKGSNKNG